MVAINANPPNVQFVTNIDQIWSMFVDFSLNERTNIDQIWSMFVLKALLIQ